MKTGLKKWVVGFLCALIGIMLAHFVSAKVTKEDAFDPICRAIVKQTLDSIIPDSPLKKSIEESVGKTDPKEQYGCGRLALDNTYQDFCKNAANPRECDAQKSDLRKNQITPLKALRDKYAGDCLSKSGAELYQCIFTYLETELKDSVQLLEQIKKNGEILELMKETPAETNPPESAVASEETPKSTSDEQTDASGKNATPPPSSTPDPKIEMIEKQLEEQSRLIIGIQHQLEGVIQAKPPVIPLPTPTPDSRIDDLQKQIEEKTISITAIQAQINQLVNPTPQSSSTPDPKIVVIEKQLEEQSALLTKIQAQIQDNPVKTPLPTSTPDLRIDSLQQEITNQSKMMADFQERLGKLVNPTPPPSTTPDPRIGDLEKQLKEQSELLTEIQTQIQDNPVKTPLPTSTPDLRIDSLQQEITNQSKMMADFQERLGKLVNPTSPPSSTPDPRIGDLEKQLKEQSKLITAVQAQIQGGTVTTPLPTLTPDSRIEELQNQLMTMNQKLNEIEPIKDRLTSRIIEMKNGMDKFINVYLPIILGVISLLILVAAFLPVMPIKKRIMTLHTDIVEPQLKRIEGFETASKNLEELLDSTNNNLRQIDTKQNEFSTSIEERIKKLQHLYSTAKEFFVSAEDSFRTLTIAQESAAKDASRQQKQLEQITMTCETFEQRFSTLSANFENLKNILTSRPLQSANSQELLVLKAELATVQQKLLQIPQEIKGQIKEQTKDLNSFAAQIRLLEQKVQQMGSPQNIPIIISDTPNLNSKVGELSQAVSDIRTIQNNVRSIAEQMGQFDDRVRKVEKLLPLPPMTPNNWCVVGKSVIGKSHIQSKIPCQDAEYIEQLDNGWGIAVVSDGAGSAKNSHIGSEFATKQSVRLFKELVVHHGWNRSQTLPVQGEWHTLAQEVFKSIRHELENYAKQNRYEISSLGCTIIAAIYSPIGILISHIGDGRAAYRTTQGEWKAMMVPWKGEEANATVFLTSSIWRDNLDGYIESRVISERITAFALMSDGCEKASFECSVLDKKTEKWSDPNRPYPKFFEPLFSNLIEMRNEKALLSEIETKWKTFLESGNSQLADEPDDKTMILGVVG